MLPSSIEPSSPRWIPRTPSNLRGTIHKSPDLLDDVGRNGFFTGAAVYPRGCCEVRAQPHPDVHRKSTCTFSSRAGRGSLFSLYFDDAHQRLRSSDYAMVRCRSLTSPSTACICNCGPSTTSVRVYSQTRTHSPTSPAEAARKSISYTTLSQRFRSGQGATVVRNVPRSSTPHQ